MMVPFGGKERRLLVEPGGFHRKGLESEGSEIVQNDPTEDEAWAVADYQ